MTKKLTILIILLANMAIARANIIEQADSAYNAAAYTEAVALYTQAIDSLGTSAQLQYNLGNALFRTGKPGMAIVAYERALRIDPSMSDARANLEFVNSKIVDRPGERGTLIGRIVRAMALWTTPNAWAWIAMILFAITLAGIGAYFFSKVIIVRKIGFFGAIVMVVVTVIAVIIAFRAAAISTATDVAVMTEPSAILSSEARTPRNQSEEVMLIHEGTKVLVIDSVANEADSTLWLDVEVDNAHRGWLPAPAVTRI